MLGQNRPELLTPLILTAALAFVLQNGLNALRIIFNNTFEQGVVCDDGAFGISHGRLEV